jgi:hypothetical protein
MAKTPAWTRKEGKNCTKCGEMFLLSDFYTTGKKVSGEPKYNSWCKSCVKEKMSSYHARTWGPDKLQFSAMKRAANVRSYLSYLRAKAVKRSGSCISTDNLEELWLLQNGMCAITGWPLTMSLGSGVVSTNASIDRIDSSIGYISGNVQLVCRAANIAKSNLSMEVFISLCRAAAEVDNGKNSRLAA